MRKRIFLLCGVIVAGVVGAALLISEWRVTVVGYLRGEPLYQGRPSSYWSGALRNYLDARESGLRTEPVTDLETDWLDPLKERSRLGVPSYRKYAVPFPNPRGDRKAIPVLIELIKDPDARVRIWVIGELRDFGVWAKEATAALINSLEDQAVWHEMTVGAEAARALVAIDPEAAARVGIKGDPKEIPELVLFLKSSRPDMRTRVFAARQLYHLSYVVELTDLKQAVPTLLDALEDHGRAQEWDDLSVAELAALTLERIEPESLEKARALPKGK